MNRQIPSVPMNLPSNSHNKKKEPETPVDKKIEKVVTGTITKRKKGIGTKFAETFLGDTVDSVSDYVIKDIVIPAGLNMASSIVDEFLNMFRGGFDMMLFGEQRSRHKYRSTTNYSKISTGGSNFSKGYSTRPQSQGRKVDTQAMHQFDDIVFDNRGDAEVVLDRMIDILEGYGFVSVSDFYEMIGERHTFADQKWGWSDLSTARPERGRNGYRIKLPRTRMLD